MLTDTFRLTRFAEVRENTKNDYTMTLDRYLIPALGQRKLRTISRADAEVLRASIRDKAFQGRGKTGIRTTNKCLALLKTVLNFAVEHGYLVRNPAKGVKALPTPSNEKRKRVDGAVMTPTELQLLFRHCTDRWRTRIITCALTGLRSGELLGLTWGNIDWVNQRIRIRHALVHGKLQEPKTPYALRTVPLPSQLITELKRWHLVCPPSELDLVFPNDAGHPESRANLISRGLHPALRRAGLPRMRFHDLRHCYASLLIDAGEPLMVVSPLLGHSSIKITADTYGHLMPDMVTGVGQRLGDRVFGSTPSKDGNFLGTFADSALKTGEKTSQATDLNGAPGGIRTPDTLVRSQVLYPAELRAR